ncbi:MAG: hypothetical protein GTN53_29440, partial [Candidatus Aminicenantes bacterium]|nr:hypothetical protein [Candidatus Aminicenantes bacterium]NIQ70599.1 hypothetical protein [Candidatus Aminicenantes bacterium]NIT26639.1 hypothetical protein [Candidatus Aminicenantes bacterium]
MIFQHYDQIILNSSLVLITQIEGPFPNEHSARLRNPGDFKEKPDWSRAGKFRRTAGGTIYGRIKVPATIGIIWGQLKTQSGRAAAPQSLRFPIKNWTAARARAWLKENKVTFIRFEPAEPRKENQGQGAQGDPGQEENKTWFNIVNANKETADVYIYEEIGGFGVDSKQFALQFNQIKASKINIHINSPGGSIFEGHAIYNTINNAKSKIIHTFIEGVAASMAAVVSLAGDVVHMAENALMMIHNPVAAVRGEQKDLKRIADVLEKLKGTIAKIYADKTGLPIETINKMMDDETWMNAGEALENKFIDKITDQVEAANVFDLENYNYKNLAIYNSIKHKLKSKNQNQEDVMNLEELKAKHPEVYEAAFNEGKTAGVEEGKQAGITEGTDAGAKAERERIQGIETIEAGEHAQIVKDNKFKPEATKDSVSALILEAENKKKKKGAQDTK